MLAEIINRTPIWVFILFFVLVVLGYIQSKPRTVGIRKVYILPSAMILLSLYGVFSAFGVEISGLIFWLVGTFIAIFVGFKVVPQKGVKYLDKERSFSIPGSWVPLMLMMAIYFTKYAVGVVLARQLPITQEMEFIALISFIYGCFSGLFFSRLIVVRKSIKQYV